MQCLNILEISAAPEHVPYAPPFVPVLQQSIIAEHVQPIIQAAGAALFTSVSPDPVVAVSVDGLLSLRGLYGYQMLSFYVTVGCLSHSAYIIPTYHVPANNLMRSSGAHSRSLEKASGCFFELKTGTYLRAHSFSPFDTFCVAIELSKINFGR